MSRSAQKSRRFKIAALLLPATLFLAACESTNSMVVEESGKINFTAHFKDDSGMATGSGIKCEDIKKEMELSKFESAMVQVQDSSSGNTLECSFNVSAPGSDILTETENTFIVKLGDTQDPAFNSEDLETFKQLGVNFALNIQMPGDIVRADGATINGNTASYTDPSVLGSQITVEGMKRAGAKVGDTANAEEKASDSKSESADTEPAKDTDTEVSDNESNPVPWILGGLILLGLIGVGVFFLTRKKPNNNPAQGYGMNGQAPFGQAPYGQQPYDQNANGQAPYMQQPYYQATQQPYSSNPSMPSQNNSRFSYAEAPAPTQPMSVPPVQPPYTGKQPQTQTYQTYSSAPQSFPQGGAGLENAPQDHNDGSQNPGPQTSESHDLDEGSQNPGPQQ
ncbi:hypothetical protein [Arcanobacterium ihumii]|uniref:hypothetical protein n=1 Tax=Arcanobacterium ihumii TaxID=2138162 RepID=UPI000F520CAC|nr:hypothetical protein [Arcanobacterium ihumii]